MIGAAGVTSVRVGVADAGRRRAGPARRPGWGPPRGRAAARRRAWRTRPTSPGGSPPTSLYVDELVPVRADLESVFLQLTGPEGLEADLMDDGQKVLR